MGASNDCPLHPSEKRSCLRLPALSLMCLLSMKPFADKRKQLLFSTLPRAGEFSGGQYPRRCTATALAPSSRASRTSAMSLKVGIPAALAPARTTKVYG